MIGRLKSELKIFWISSHLRQSFVLHWGLQYLLNALSNPIESHSSPLQVWTIRAIASLESHWYHCHCEPNSSLLCPLFANVIRKASEEPIREQLVLQFYQLMTLNYFSIILWILLKNWVIIHFAYFAINLCSKMSISAKDWSTHC